MEIGHLIGTYWWILVIILMVIFYRLIFKLFGVIIVPDDSIGLITKKFVLLGKNKELPNGRIIALNGEAGKQAHTLPPGIYFGFWIWQYTIVFQKFISIPNGKIGLVNARDGASLSPGRILGDPVLSDNFQDAEAFIKNGGIKGKQIAVLTSGSYRINTLLFEIAMEEQTQIKEDQICIITAKDGLPLGEGHIAGKVIDGHNNFQDFGMFIKNGGERGLQEQVVLAGTYNFNKWALEGEILPLTEVPIGHVGVIISYVGKEGRDVSGAEFKHGNIVSKGEKGVWNEPLGAGKYAINPHTLKMELVPTTNLVLNWANAISESHHLDEHLSTITVRSKDGYSFNLDVSQIIHVPATEAAKVIARFGSMRNLVSQVLEPTIGNYFRNSAQNSDVISFLSEREKRQQEAKQHISTVLSEYNVIAVDTLIGDINPPVELMKTLTDRKLAQEQQATYRAQEDAQKARQSAEKEKSLADMQGELVKAEQSVIIAERGANASIRKSEGDAQSIKLKAGAEAEATRVTAIATSEAIKVKAIATAEGTKATAEAEAQRIEKTGKAEAVKILEIGKSNAEAYRQAVTALGNEHFTSIKLMEELTGSGMKLVPDVLITGGEDGQNPVSGLLGLRLLDEIKVRAAKGNENPPPPEMKVENKK
jgi:uncharacterized membrane protein YqiK